MDNNLDNNEQDTNDEVLNNDNTVQPENPVPEQPVYNDPNAGVPGDNGYTQAPADNGTASAGTTGADNQNAYSYGQNSDYNRNTEYNTNSQQYWKNQNDQNPNGSKNNGMAIASLVLGIVSIPAGCCYGVGTVLGIVGIILALVSRSQTGKFEGLALGGLICSIVGVLFGVAFWILFAIGSVVGTDVYNNLYY